jgi:hypothetical protein
MPAQAIDTNHLAALRNKTMLDTVARMATLIESGKSVAEAAQMINDGFVSNGYTALENTPPMANALSTRPPQPHRLTESTLRQFSQSTSHVATCHTIAAPSEAGEGNVGERLPVDSDNVLEE